jgi:hypothetical protein
MTTSGHGRIVTRLALTAVAAAGLIAAAGSPAMVQGVSYRVRVQTQMGNGGGEGGRGFGGGQSQLVRVDLAGDRAKVEFQIGNPPGSSLSDYSVMLLDSNKVYRISPDEQTYTDASLNGARGGRGGRGPGGGGDFNRGGGGGRGNRGGGDGARGGRGGGFSPTTVLQDLVITGTHVQTEDLGAGDPIESRPTRHYRITADYDFTLYGQPRKAKTVSEVWAVDFPVRVVDPFEGESRASDSLSYAGISARLVAEAQKIPGAHVKTVTTQTVPVAVAGGADADVTESGQVAETVSIVRTTTITALKDAEVDATMLSVPAGYRKVGFSRGGQQD